MNRGTHYADYDIINLLGSGSMGTVYLATHRSTGQQVAIKVVPGGSSPEDQEKIAIEESGAALQHQIAKDDPRVVVVNRIGRFNGDLVVEMEYVRGDDLLNSMRKSPFSPGRAASISLDLCRMLDNLDRLQPAVVHGDLKPRNVLLSGNRDVKVADFGIAKQIADANGIFNAYHSVPYASPERLDSSMVNLQSDLWSVGVMLYEMAAGRHPFACANGDLRNRILDGSGPDPLPGAIPEPLRNIIFRALAPSIDDRYTTARDMAGDLQRYLANERVEAAAPDDQATRRTHPTISTSKIIRTTRPSQDVGVFQRHRRAFVRLVLFGTLIAVTIYFANGLFKVSNEADGIRRQLDSDRISVATAWKRYEDLRPRAKVAFLLSGLQGSLKKKLMEAGSAPIFDYRRDQPAAREGDWDRAVEDFHRILDLDPKDQTAQSLLLLCEGHLYRIRAKSGNGRKATINRKVLNQAILKFEEAAKLMPDSSDPYLGLARIYFYDEHDFNRGDEMLNEAAKRGHPIGKREKLQRADALRNRAMRSVQQSQGFAGVPDREKQSLESAREDFRSAVETYNELTDFSAAAPSIIKDTLRRLQQVDLLLQQLNSPSAAAQ